MPPSAGTVLPRGRVSVGVLSLPRKAIDLGVRLSLSASVGVEFRFSESRVGGVGAGVGVSRPCGWNDEPELTGLELWTSLMDDGP